MLSFLQPQWLWATAAVAIPVLIHFWNVSKGRVLKIGSIAFIPSSSRKTSNRLQLSELLLLFLRCMFVLLLSFFLAKPQWSNHTAGKKESGWIIADPGVGTQTISGHQSLLDSLRNNGYVFRKWDTSLSMLNYKQWMEEFKNDQSAIELRPWELVYLINKKVAKDFPVYVFAKNQLSLFNGRRPASNADIHWIFKQAQNDPVNYLSEARLISGDSADIVINTGAATGIRTSKEKISLTNPPSAYTVKNEKGRVLVSKKGESFVIADTAPAKIIIVDDPGRNDGRYVKAAIEAISSATAVPIAIKSFNVGDSLQNDADWVFWLSEKPVPGGIRAKNIFSYAPGEPTAKKSVLLTKGDYSSTGGEVHLFRMIAGKTSPEGDKLIWYDASGAAVLYRDSANPSRLFFRSRFNPAWSDLIWNESFPYRIYALLFEKTGTENVQKNDPRILDRTQVKSGASYTSINSTEIPAAESQISPWIWWLLLITLCIERIVALHSKTSSR